MAMMTASSSLLAILAGVFVGILALVLVANEIGGRAGLPPPGRLLLAGGLGFGVFAFAIKAILIIEIGSVGLVDLATKPRPRSTAQAMAAEEAWPARHRVSPLWSTWQALPATPPEPAGNRSTTAKIALGKRLFEDRDLSADRTVACASCHGLAGGGDDGRAVSLGVGNQAGGRNAPSVVDAAWLSRLFWDGRAGSLEEQAKGPLLNPVEMAMPSGEAVVARIAGKPGYGEMFAAAFGPGRAIDFDAVAKAIAAFERTLVSRNAPYDRFVSGDDGALGPAALRGMALFEEIGCRSCHIDPTFSAAGRDKPFGVYRPFPVFADDDLLHRYRLDDERRAAWRVPSLRNVALTAPYMHNGAVESLEEAVRLMAVLQLGLKLSNDPALRMAVTPGPVEDGNRRSLTVGRRRALGDDDIADLVAFLDSLTGWPAPTLAAK